MKKTLCRTVLAAGLAIGALAATAGTASAYVVCNGVGDCWHTDHRAHFGPAVRLEYHPDDWYFHRDWGQDKDHHWRDYHEGRGYYNNGAWVPR